MTSVQKILAYVGALALIFLVCYIVILRYEASLQQHAIDQENINQKKLDDFLVRASASYVSRTDLEKMISDEGINLKAVKDDIGKLNGSVTALTITVASSKTQIVVSGGGTYIPTPIPSSIPTTPSGHAEDVNDWYKERAHLDISEKFGDDSIPFGSVEFQAQNPKGKEWNETIYGRKYKMDAVIANTEERNRIITYSQFSIDSNGKTYKVPVDSKTTEVFPESSFKWHIHPSLYAGAGYSSSGFSQPIGASLSLAAFGKYSKSPELVFLDIGIGYNTTVKTIEFSVFPVSYNISSLLSMFSNTYVTAGFGVGVDKSYSAIVGIKVEL